MKTNCAVVSDVDETACLLAVQDGVVRGWYMLPERCRPYIEWSGISLTNFRRANVEVKASLGIPLQGEACRLKLSRSFEVAYDNGCTHEDIKIFAAGAFKRDALALLHELKMKLQKGLNELTEAME